MAFSIRTAARLAGLSTLTLGAGLFLAGCASAAPDVDQSVDVTYTADGETVEVAVEVPQLVCSEAVGQLTYTADDDDDRSNGRLVLATAPGADGVESYVVSVALGEGLYFVSSNEFTNTESGIELTNLEGIVSPVTYDGSGGSDFGGAIDTTATASGTLECTTTD